jgi:hypothetical protein
MLQPVFLNTPNLVVKRKDACGLLVLCSYQLRAISALLLQSPLTLLHTVPVPLKELANLHAKDNANGIAGHQLELLLQLHNALNQDLTHSGRLIPAHGNALLHHQLFILSHSAILLELKLQ